MLLSNKAFAAVALIAGLGCVAAIPQTAHAQLLGEKIDGTLNFGGFGGTNFYAPLNIQTVVDPGVEFKYGDSYSHVDTDLTDNTVTLTQYSSNGGALSGSNSWFISLKNLDSTNVRVQPLCKPLLH